MDNTKFYEQSKRSYQVEHWPQTHTSLNQSQKDIRKTILSMYSLITPYHISMTGNSRGHSVLWIGTL